MKPKSGDKGSGEAVEPSLPVVPSSKNVVIPGTSVMARRSANIQKANDGSLIYRRRHALPSPASAVTPESKGADVLVQTRSQGKDTSRSKMNLPIEKRSDRKRLAESDISPSMSVPKRRRTIRNTADGTCVESDAFCWICHRDGQQGICCELCPRLYHIKCLGIEQPSGEWICPECEKIMVAENTETRSKAMLMLSMDALCTLLKFVLRRMKYPETDPFQRPVDCALIPTYTDFIFNAMDFSTLEKNIKKKAYGSTEAFVADVKWILHNCIVFNGKKNRLTNIAKTILKVCRHETNEIEVCPDCYMNSCVKPSDNWFCQPCRTPHILVWAKMKGYPFWPAKVLREDKGLIDVRFFGEHDRAWVPVSQIFMMSEEPPTSLKNRKGFEQATEELRWHIDLLREKFGSFTYAPHRTPYDPSNPYSKVSLSVLPQNQPVFRSKRIKKSKHIMKVRNVDETQKGVRIFISKISDKPASITKKTACAVRLKYNSIISTRMASAKKIESSQAATSRTEVLESRDVVAVEGIMQKESDADNKDVVPRDSDRDKMEYLHSEQNVSFLSGERSISESRDIVDLDASIGKNLESTSDISCSCRSEVQSNESESVKQPATGSGVLLGENATVEERDQCLSSASNILKSVSDVSEIEAPLGSNYQNSENVTLQTSVETTTICHDQPVIQDSCCLSSTDNMESIHDSADHIDQGRNSDSVHTAVVESTERETALTSGEPSHQTEKTEHDTDLPAESSGAFVSSSNNADESSTPSLEEPPETNVPNDSLKLVLCPQSTSKDGLENNAKKSIEMQPSCVIIESEERLTPALEPFLENVFVSSDAKLSLNNVSSVKQSVLNSCVSAANLESPLVAVTVTNPNATAVDGISSVNKQPVSHTESNQLNVFKAAVSVSNEASDIAVDSSRSDIVENNSPVKSDINAVRLDCPRDMPAGLDSSILKSLASDVEERTSKMADSRAVASPLVTIETETTLNRALALSSPETGAETELGSDCQQTETLARDVCSSSPLPEANADDLLMEVDCEDDVSVVVIDDEVEQSFGSATMLIKDVKSLQPTKNLREISDVKNGEEVTQIISTVDSVASSLGQTLPLLQNFSQPEMPSIRSPYLATVLSKTPTLTTSAKLPCFPVRNLVLAVSGTVTQHSGSAVSSQLSAPGPTALCQSLSSNAGTSSPGTSTNSAVGANISGAASFEFNIEGFDYSKYTNKIIDSTKNMLKEFCQDMMNAEVGSAMRKHLQLELDRIRWRHEQELNEIKHNAAIQLAELRLALEHDKEFSLSELRQKLVEEKKKEIEEVKKKQWCANCGKEAIFYCCWNTSYCNYPCQQAHWPKHMHSCTQAPEGSQSHDEQATANQPDDRGAVNLPSNQQQKWKDNPDLSINAALKQQELDRQLRLTFSMNAGGNQYLSNQPHTLPSIQISSANNHHIGVHQQPTPPVVQVQYSAAAPYNNSSIHMTSYLSSVQQPASLLHPQQQQQQFRLRANQLQQHQPGIIMYPGVPTAVLTTRHGNQTIPIGSIQPGPIYQPKKY